MAILNSNFYQCHGRVMRSYHSQAMKVIPCIFDDDCLLYLVILQQVDVASDFKETETMINELVNMKIPEFKNSSNHVQLVEQGLLQYSP